MINNLTWVKQTDSPEKVSLYFTINKHWYNTYICMCGCKMLFTNKISCSLKKAIKRSKEEKCKQPEPEISEKFIKEATRFANLILLKKINNKTYIID